MVSTGSSNLTIYYEDGELVFPCRCGEVHREQDIYDLGWTHTCFHDDTLLILSEQSIPDLQVGCPDCGKCWRASTKTQEELDKEKGLDG